MPSGVPRCVIQSWERVAHPGPERCIPTKRMSTFLPGRIEVAPHESGPEHGWFWRIDPDVSRAKLDTFNDWSGPEDLPEAAFFAAIWFLIAYAASHDQREAELFAPGVSSVEQKCVVVERFFRTSHDTTTILRACSRAASGTHYRRVSGHKPSLMGQRQGGRSSCMDRMLRGSLK